MGLQLEWIRIPLYHYSDGVDTVIMRDVLIGFTTEDADSYRRGADIESLDYFLPGDIIVKGEKLLEYKRAIKAQKESK